MEEPPSLSSEDVRARKVELLKTIPPLLPEDVLIGQYIAGEVDGVLHSGYREDPTVPDDSITPTFAKIAFSVENERWEDVPFTITAGKGMSRSMSEVRIKFKSPKSNIFCKAKRCPPPNVLTIRIQPNEGIHLDIVNKIPGESLGLNVKKLDLSYSSAYEGEVIPDAYESLLLDVMNGEKALFIRDDELRAAWDIFTPLLHHLEEHGIKPSPYPFGTDGPRERTTTPETHNL
jgi:glucose-6-phosphate 1-dehydrogenase